MCRTAVDVKVESAVSACLIKAGSEVLLLQQHSGLFSLPLADTQGSDNAQCQLHQQIWQDTGVNVEVGEPLLVTDTLTLFQCEEQAGLSEISQPFPAPDWSDSDVAWVKQNPYALTMKQMANRDHLIPLRDSLNVLNDKLRNENE